MVPVRAKLSVWEAFGFCNLPATPFLDLFPNLNPSGAPTSFSKHTTALGTLTTLPNHPITDLEFLGICNSVNGPINETVSNGKKLAHYH